MLRRPCSRSGRQRPKALKETIRKLATQAEQAGYSSTPEFRSISIRRLSGRQGFQASHPGKEWTSVKDPQLSKSVQLRETTGFNKTFYLGKPGARQFKVCVMRLLRLIDDEKNPILLR